MKTMIEAAKRRPVAAVSILVVAATAAILAAVLSRTSGATSVKATPAPPLVNVSTVETRDLPLKLSAQGHLVALSQVDVRSQATGTVRSIHFKEGDEVKAGQLMFTIDAADVTAQLAKSRAGAAQFKAQVDEAQRDLTRTQQLAKSRFYSAAAVDSSQSKLESLQAQYRAAQADIDNTRVLVDRTRVVAPMNGLTGALAAHIGSLAQPGSATALVNVLQIDPIGVEFTLPEAELAALLAARAAGTVRVSVAAPGGRQIDGKLVFINNSVDVNTGTISVKAAFPNAGKSLWPGAFVKVQLIAGVSRGAVVLPPQSILDGPKGRLVYTLDGQGKAVSTPVTLLRLQDQMAVVEGLAGGQTVITEGQLGLKNGSTVRVAINAGSGARPGTRSPVASSAAP